MGSTISQQGRRLGRLAAALALSALAASWASAQSAADTEELRRRSQREAQERQRQQQAPDVRLERPATLDPMALDLPDETPCFPIRQFKLDGEPPAAFAWIGPWLERYAGRCIGRGGIELVLRRLSAKIIADGYVTTRVGLPEQDLSGGTLRLTLQPGRIRAIRFADPALDANWRSAFPARSGDLLNLRDIEQGLEQLKRVPSQDAQIDIAPGEAPGESDLVISLKRGKPWRLTFAADDAGTAANGRRQGSLTLALDHPLDLNDLLSVGLNADLANDPHTRGTDGHAVTYSLPWGNWTFQLSDTVWRYRQTVQGINQTFLSSGTSHGQELRIQRLLQRGQFSKTTLQFRTAARTQRSAIDHVEIDVQSQRTALAELGLIHRHYLGDAQLDLTLAHREGVPWSGALRDEPGRAADGPTRRYRLETLDAALLAPFKLAGRTLRWNSVLHLQQTGDTLYTADYLSIGNRYTVRGFDGERTLAAERGGYWRNDLEMPLGESGQAFYIGLDHGRVDGPGAAPHARPQQDRAPRGRDGPGAAALAGRKLTGAALGLRGSVAGSVSAAYDLFAGWALEKPAGLVTARPALGFQLSLSY